MMKLAGKGSEIRICNQIRQGSEKVEEHSNDHPGKEEDKSDLAKTTRYDGSDE